MRLVERHIIKRSHLGFKEVDRIAFLAKNLFNSALYPSFVNLRKTSQFLNSVTIIHARDCSIIS
jgi:hypothetical protein